MMTKQERTRPTLSTRRQPVRTCVGCGERRPAQEMIRSVWVIDRVEINRTAPGRGAWACGTDCLSSSRARRGMERSLRRPIRVEDFEDLLHRLAAEHNN